MSWERLALACSAASPTGAGSSSSGCAAGGASCADKVAVFLPAAGGGRSAAGGTSAEGGLALAGAVARSGGAEDGATPGPLGNAGIAATAGGDDAAASPASARPCCGRAGFALPRSSAGSTNSTLMASGFPSRSPSWRGAARPTLKIMHACSRAAHDKPIQNVCPGTFRGYGNGWPCSSILPYSLRGLSRQKGRLHPATLAHGQPGGKKADPA